MLIEEFFCSKVVIENRDKVRNSPADKFPEQGESVVGHIFERDGKYRSYWMKYDPDNVARFICSCEKDKLLCNNQDYAILNTQGKYLDLSITDKNSLSQLLDVLTVYQKKIASDTKFTYEN